MKHQPFYRTIRTAGIFLLCLMMMNIANAQFGSVNVKKLKEEQRAKKVEKSKASTDIKALESAISELKRLNGNSDKDLAGKNYESYAQNQKTATEHLANIKKKDPKWKIATYETSLQTFSRRLTKIGPLHKLEGKKEELRTFIKKKDRISAFSNCDSQLEKVKEADASTVDCGQKFYNYYVERVEADVLHKKMVELKKIDPKYMESVNSYMRRDYLEGYTSWLEGILAQANDFSNNTLKKTDFHKLTSQTKLVISYLKWKVKTVEKLAPEMATACTKTNLNLKKARAHVHEFRLKESMISPENIGKIIFTKTDVGRKEFASVQKLTSWNLAKPLNYRFFMNQTPQEFHAEVNTDGRMSPEKAVIVEKIYLDGDLFMNDYSIKTFYDSQDLYLNAMTMRNIEEDALYRNLVMKISKMGYGTYQLKIEMYMREKDGSKLSSRMATGEIKIVYNAEGKAQIKKNHTLCIDKRMMTNATLEKEMLTLGKTSERIKDFATFKRAVIVEAAWRVERQKYTGQILSRAIDGVLVGVDKQGNCVKQLFGFVQEYQGGGRYGKTKDGGWGDLEIIPCLCTK